MHTLHHHMQPHMARAENAQAVGTGATQGYCQAAYVRRATAVDTRACAASNIGSTQSTCMSLTSSVLYSSSKYVLNSLHNFETSSMRRLKTATDAFLLLPRDTSDILFKSRLGWATAGGYPSGSSGDHKLDNWIRTKLKEKYLLACHHKEYGLCCRLRYCTGLPYRRI